MEKCKLSCLLLLMMISIKSSEQKKNRREQKPNRRFPSETQLTTFNLCNTHARFTKFHRARLPNQSSKQIYKHSFHAVLFKSRAYFLFAPREQKHIFFCRTHKDQPQRNPRKNTEIAIATSTTTYCEQKNWN
jgi:hypothetical protein